MVVVVMVVVEVAVWCHQGSREVANTVHAAEIVCGREDNRTAALVAVIMGTVLMVV